MGRANQRHDSKCPKIRLRIVFYFYPNMIRVKAPRSYCVIPGEAKGKPQTKFPPLIARPLRGGVKRGPLREKQIFFRQKKVPIAIELEGELFFLLS